MSSILCNYCIPIIQVARLELYFIKKKSTSQINKINKPKGKEKESFVMYFKQFELILAKLRFTFILPNVKLDAVVERIYFVYSLK